MLNNPFRHTPEGLDPNDTEFLKRFGGLEVDNNKDIPAQAKEAEIPADEAVGLGVTAEKREAFLNELVDIAPGFKIPRKEYEAVVEIFNRINEDVPNEKKIVIEDVVGNEKSGRKIQIEENHVIRLYLTFVPIESLDGIILPEGLQRLYLFNTQIQSLDGVKLPEGLQDLDLSVTQVESLDGVKLPEGLQDLNLSNTPIQSLVEVKLPKGLQILILESTPIQSLDGVVLPEGLRILYLTRTSIQSIDDVKFPELLKEVHLGDTPLFKNPQRMTELRAKYPNIVFEY